MRMEGEYIIGTIGEMVGLLIPDNYEEFNNFKGVDFVVLDEGEEESSLEYLYGIYGNNYGIKKIDTGFDSVYVDLFCDYYGGGAGVFQSLSPDSCKEEWKEKVSNMINQSLLKNDDYCGCERLCVFCCEDILDVSRVLENKK